MKTKIYFLLPFLIGIFSSCEEGEQSEPNAVACFDYSPTVELKDSTEISFSNCSENATSYAWNFGDGTFSTEENPAHTYEESGDFVVQLAAINETSVDSISKNLLVTSSRTNHLIHNDETFPLTQAFVAHYTYEEGVKRFMINLGGDGIIDIANDQFDGTGEWVTVFLVGTFTEGTFTIIDDSWAISNYVSGDTNETSLEGGTVKIISASNPIELEINAPNTEVYYKGDVDIVNWDES